MWEDMQTASSEDLPTAQFFCPFDQDSGVRTKYVVRIMLIGTMLWLGDSRILTTIFHLP